MLQRAQLLTAKPVLYVCNVDGSAPRPATRNARSERVAERATSEGAAAVVISAAIEAEIAQLADADEKREVSRDLGLDETGLDRVIRAGYELLDLDHLLHRRAEGGARLDRPPRRQGARGGRRHPHRFRARLHPRRDHRLRRFHRLRRRSGRQGSRQDARRRQGICRPGRRRLAVPLQRLGSLPPLLL